MSKPTVDLSKLTFYRIQLYSSLIDETYCSTYEEAERLLVNYHIKEMLEYYCDGCHWCCYGKADYKEWCERRFNNASELPDYFRMYAKSPQRYLGYIEEVSFEALPSGGFKHSYIDVLTAEQLMALSPEYMAQTYYGKDKNP